VIFFGLGFETTMTDRPRFGERGAQQTDPFAGLAQRDVAVTHVDPHAHRFVRLAAAVVDRSRLAIALDRFEMSVALGEDPAERVQGSGGEQVDLLGFGQRERLFRFDFRQEQITLVGMKIREVDERPGHDRRGQRRPDPQRLPQLMLRERQLAEPRERHCQVDARLGDQSVRIADRRFVQTVERVLVVRERLTELPGLQCKVPFRNDRSRIALGGFEIFVSLQVDHIGECLH
jgi:hypothetical protein